MSYHKVSLIGNLGKEPDAKMTPAGKFVCHISVASNRKYTSNGQEVKETIWWNISVWGKMGENVNQYLHKGSKIYAEGFLSPAKDGGARVWQGNDGVWHGSYDLMATEVRFLDSKNGGSDIPEGSDPVEESEKSDQPIPF